MKIVIFGAGGDVGSRAALEAHGRGHNVTAVGRRLANLDKLPVEVEKATGDARDARVVKSLSADCDLIISSTRPARHNEAELVDVARTMMEVSRDTGIRVIIIGGAATLIQREAGERTVIEDPAFPTEIRPIAEACQAQHQVCLESCDANWTYMSPPCLLIAGKRTGRFRVGNDHVIVGADGRSVISMEDFAIALIDEAERKEHVRKRFTVGY